MNKTNKIRVAVLYGGRSGEHEVSLVSATNVVKNLDRTRFEVIPIGIDKQGVWYLGDDILPNDANASVTQLRIHAEESRLLFKPDLIGKASAVSSNRLFDVIFPVIHGTLCEDGTLQGLLELADVPYVGCGVLSSAVGMDKDVSKRLIQHAGILTPDYITITRGQWDKNPALFLEKVAKRLPYPLFVKPANTGSSVGVAKVNDPSDLTAAIHDAFQYDTKVVVEQGIDAREIEVAVLESTDAGADPIVSIPGEICPTGKHEFYSYASKYTDQNGAEAIIPAVISEDVKQKVQQAARDIFLALDCEGMARVDLFLERTTQQIYFNEVNTLPGFTQISMYPKLMAASGVPYSELLTHLITLAFNRHQRKSRLSREWIAKTEKKTHDSVAANISH